MAPKTTPPKFPILTPTVQGRAPLKDYYDWVVFGDHPGALLSAVLMAKKGFSALILLKDPERPGETTFRLRSGERLDPEPNAVTGWGSRGLLRECLETIEAQIPVSQTADDGLQMLTPHLRLKLTADLKEMDLSFAMQCGRKGLKISSGLQNLQAPYQQFWGSFTDYAVPPRTSKTERRPKVDRTVQLARDTVARAKSALKPAALGFSELPTHLSAEIRNGLLAACYGTIRETEAPERDWLPALWMARSQVSIRGGLSAYRAALIAAGEHYGVHVAGLEHCRRLFLEKRRLIGLQWADRGKMIELGGGALGDSMETLTRLLDGQKIRLRTPPRILGWRMTVGIRVRTEGFPPGVLRRNVFKQLGAPWIECEVTDPSESPEGFHRQSRKERILSLRTVLPWTEESLKPEVQRRICMRMFAQAKQMFPFMDYHVVNSFPDLSTSDAAFASYREAYGFSSLEAIPEALRVYEDQGMGVFSGIDGLFVTNQSSFPEYGSWAGGFGGPVAALESLAWFSEDRRQAGDMRFGRGSGRFHGFLDSPKSS